MQAGQQFLHGMGFVAVYAMLNFSIALAQNGIDEVHIQPRVQTSQQSTTGVIRKNVNLVLVPVTVTDESNRIVTGLGQENFQLFEDKHPQPIKHFWQEDTPVSIGIVLDVSGSTADCIG